MTTMKTETRKTQVLVVLALAALLGGCAAPMPGDAYHQGQTLRAQSVELGVVDSVRPVQIQRPDTGVGTFGGATLGGIAGSTIGGSSAANAAGAIFGAILGGLAGNAIERDAGRAQGLEVTVRLDAGPMIAVVQEGYETFRPGDRVRVLSDGYATRVTR